MAHWWFWRLAVVVAAVGLCSQFQVYHLSAVNNVLDVALPSLIHQFDNDRIVTEQ